ncbi:complement regulatory protein [Trypanosoma cruzi]|nr:complement regulatory protein [Trypanosoma cruzi]
MHAQDADCSGFGCFFFSAFWRLRVAAASSVGMKRGEERGSARRVTLLPAGVMRAMGCDCCGGPHPFRCALLRRCAVRLCMCFRSVGRPPPFFCGLCEWARADEGQGAWNEGMA